MSWGSCKIADVTQLVTKGTTPTKQQGFAEHGINYVKAEALNGGRSLDRKGIYFISEEVHQSLSRSHLYAGDVLLTIAGANIGRCGLVGEEDTPANTNQAVGIIRTVPDKMNPLFLYYWFAQPSTYRFIQGLNAQAAQPNINLSTIKSFDVPAPPLSTQTKIADILSAYDDLIENNRRRIQILEESARLLYREWFVHLRFPGHETTRIVDGVPEGWELISVGDASSQLSRGIAPKYDIEAQGLVINQKCIRDFRVSLTQARHQSKKVPEAKTVQRGDVLINSTGTGTLGRLAQVMIDWNDVTVDSHVTIVRPLVSISPLVFGRALENLQPVIEQMGRGSTGQTELSSRSLAELPLLLPPKDLSAAYDELVQENYYQAQNLLRQSEVAAESRNLLLPKLMSGEVAV